MKRIRDDDKVMGPLFPRLHVNDADKGGPRAPPRNKMALYELLSIPSQMFNADAAATLPKQLQRAGRLAPSAFSSQGRGRERSVSSPFCTPHTPVHMAEKVHPHSMGGINQDAMSMDLEKKSSKHGSRVMTNSAGNVQMDVKCSSLHPDDLSNVKVPFGKKSGDEDDFRVPSCLQPGFVLNSDKDHHSMDREGTIDSNLNSPQKNGAPAFSSQGQVQSNHGKTLQRHHTHSSMLQQHESTNEGKAKETVTLGKSMEDPMSHPAIREKAVDPSKICRSSSNEGHPSYKLNELNTSQGENVRQCQESHGSFGERRYLSDSEFKEKQVISNGRTESCSKMSLDRDLLEPSIPEYCDLAVEDVTRAEGAERTGSPEDANKTGMLEDADINDDVSETSMVDSMPGVDICPDDVVGLIGPKHFWKARRALVNQQRVFAVQVFELHRLIKVQKLIAGSPHLLLEETSYLHGSPKAPVKDPSARFRVKPHLQVKQKDESHKVNNSECATENTESANLVVYPQVKIIKHKDESHKAICNSECATENTGGNLPLSHEHGEGPISQIPRDGSCSGKVSSFPAPSDNSGAWCFHPPGNQWLIPVMSPSEGLIYKPYTGPCPPSGAFMAPVYSGCGPLSVPSVAGDLMKPAFGVPTPHQQQGMGAFPGAPAVAPNYFPAPYALPVANPLISSSPVEPVRSMAGPRPSAQLEQQSRSSCNMSNLRREATSEHAPKVHVSHENDVQGSTASCASDRSRGDVHPRLPMASSRYSSGRPPQAHGRDHRARVIKVVPHNARSATESAARIFRSIQKERQQHDSV